MKIRFIQKIIDKFRKKQGSKAKIKGVGNNISLPKNDKNAIRIEIFGNNNEIIFDEDIKLFVGDIYIGTPDCTTDNCKVVIKKGVTSNGCSIRILEDSSIVKIGENSMLSTGIYIAASDTHCVLDTEGNLLNEGRFVDIGTNVWIGLDVKIGKNTRIPNGCIIGAGSIVTKSFSEENCLIAGNPASIKKRNIKWDRMRPKQFLSLQK